MGLRYHVLEGEGKGKGKKRGEESLDFLRIWELHDGRRETSPMK